MNSIFSEDTLIEQPALTLLGQLGWKTANCFEETFGAEGMLSRETKSKVVLHSRLQPALEKLNTELSPQALDLAIEELLFNRLLMSVVEDKDENWKLPLPAQ